MRNGNILHAFAEIDFYGNETGYTFTHKKTYSILDKTPQRYTEVINVVPGRYKIRVYRTDELGEITIKLNKNINIVHN